MAFTANAIWDVRSTGSDGSNAGAFDPSATMATDLAATVATGTAPVVTSASYNFSASDVGAYLFVKSGTNWRPGWYPIASVASNAATLNAAAGAYTLYAASVGHAGIGTAAGCATTASPTAGSWSVDYSQQDAARLAFTDLVIGATATQFTSAAHPVGPNFAGNFLVVTAGTGFTVQRVCVNSVSGTTATCDKSLGTAASTGGTGGLGGSLASPGQAAGLRVSGNGVWWKAGTYTGTATTANVSGGKVSDTVGGGGGNPPGRWVGYDAIRGDNTGNKPEFQAAAGSMTLFAVAAGDSNVENVLFTNPSAFTSVLALTHSGSRSNVLRCRATGFTQGFVLSGTGQTLDDCSVSGGTGTNAIEMSGNPAYVRRCVAVGYTGVGIGVTNFGIGAMVQDCLVSGCTGGINVGSTSHNPVIANTTIYGSSTYGVQVGCPQCTLDGVILSGNSTYGLVVTSSGFTRLYNCAGLNGTANIQGTPLVNEGFITLSGSPFSNAASGDFSLNATAGAGAACKAAGIGVAAPGLVGVSYPDLGAYQSPTASSSMSAPSAPIKSATWSFIG